MFLPHFDVICDLLLNRRTATWNPLVLHNNEERALFISKSFNVSSKAGLYGISASLRPLWRTRKKPFDVVYRLYKMKQSHWLLCVAKNCDWSRKITPLSQLTFRGMKTYSESRIELQNLQILKKYWTSQVSFCHQSSPISRKASTSPGKLQELN